MKPLLLAQWLWRRLSIPGALGLLLGAAALWIVVIEQPRLQAAGAQAQRDVAALQTRIEAQVKLPPAQQSSDEERLTRFYATLTPAAEVPKVLAQVFTLAQAAKINLRQGDFQRVDNRPGKFAAVQFNLPVKASYPQLTTFVDEVMSAIPSLTLEEVVFKRETASSATLDATLKFMLFIGE